MTEPADALMPRVESSGEGKLFTAIVRDIAGRERIEKALRASEQQQASILDSLSTHVVVVDSQGIVLAENDPELAFAKRDHPLHFEVGANYFESCRLRIGDWVPELRAAFEAIQAVFDGERDFAEASFPVHTPNEERWLSMSATPLRGSDGGVVISYQDITQRKQHEQDVRDLSGRVIQAQEHERSRIARELHDDVNQQLAIVCIELQQLEPYIPPECVDAHQKVQEIWKKTCELSTDIQRLSHQLHSAKLEYLGLTAALRGLCNEFTTQHNISTDFKSRHVPPVVDSDISLGLFRAAQESLRNVAKHSGAKNVRVHLIGGYHGLVLRISDDGRGFDTSIKKTKGLGLVSISERMRLVGGTFSVSSRPSFGTRIQAEVPIAREQRVLDSVVFPNSR